MSQSRGTVPVTRRLLTARPARSLAGAVGIGLALLLILLLEGLWAGVQERVTTYEDHLRAQLVVVPTGTRDLFADSGVLPGASVTAIRTTPGVESAEPISTLYVILELHHEKAAVAAVGSEPGGAGGPWAFADGRAPRSSREITVDEVFADQHGLDLGDSLPFLGHPMRVVGISTGTSMFMTPLVFTTEQAMRSMVRAPETVGAVLVSTSDPVRTEQNLSRQGFTVRTPRQLHDAALNLATSIYGAPVGLMLAVAFAAGTLITALVAYTRVAEQQRDLGVLKAVGAGHRTIRRIALAQTLALTAAGLIVSLVLILVAQRLVGVWRPTLPVTITPAVLVRTAAIAVIIALLSAWLPARRLSRLDAATAFRSRS